MRILYLFLEYNIHIFYKLIAVGYYLMGKDSNFKPKKLDVKEKVDSLVDQYFSNRDDDNDAGMDEVEKRLIIQILLIKQK